MVHDEQLPPVQIIGFTGHRHLTNPDAVSRIIRAELTRLREKLPGEITGYSSVAIGADTLFAEVCQSLDIPWIAMLPFPRAEFQVDFSENDWAHATELLSRAIRVEISGTSEDREAAYLRCGQRTVDGADLVLAV